ncbi:hypothetical protein Spp001_23 [Shewanella phage Spp001]|uniref:Uncharacterized protein n=1 Tax=Shewanella phage Spp001 TaxID=1445859 RepID=W6E9H3_9CAUD|nr:hypothetical protein Spp001_23 [Shewanella phage Spp001]AHJ10531.1 hypothetical protein Spp001_23 [Shewanella phage Spp001]
MALKTRLDARSKDNDYLTLVHTPTGEPIARIRALSARVELEIDSIGDIHIEKPSGFTSRK